MAIPYTSNYDTTISFSDTDIQLTLIANSVQTYTVPGAATQKYTALFSYNQQSNVFVGKNNTAAIPVADTHTTLQYVEFKPVKRYVNGGDVLSFISPDATAYMGVSIRAIP